MCGFTGFFSIGGLNQSLNAFIKANELIQHRGPDGQGFAFFDTRRTDRAPIVSYGAPPELIDPYNATLVLGHRRLAIIDLSSAGLQPMANEDSSIWIVYNGEVYNYIELRKQLEESGHLFRSHSDTEIIIHAYEEWGEECVNQFNGIWAFAIADLNNNKLFCSRDRFGVKPFHYYTDGRRFLFGSEIKQLLCFPFVAKQMNERIVYEYLAYSALDHSEETFYDGILKLRHGHNMSIDLTDCSMSLKQYYRPCFQINTNISSDEAASELRRLLTDSIRLQLRSDVEIGNCLSGGLDSSSLVCYINRFLKREGKGDIQHTFSSHFDTKEANELDYMQEVIQRTGVRAAFTYPTPGDFLQDIERLVWYQEEPFGSTSIFAQWSVFKLVHEHGIKVMLDGQGADEQLAGYVGLYYDYFKELKVKRKYIAYLYETWQYAHLHRKSWFDLISTQSGHAFTKSFSQHKPGFSLHTDWLNPIFATKYKGTGPFLESLAFTPFGGSEHLNNTLYRLTFRGNLQQLLRYEDRNSMAFSVEARVPFLDHRLVEFVFSLPSKLKIRDGLTKRVLRDGMVGILPEKIRRRISKLGFATPEFLWQCTVLRPLIERAIQDERMRSFLVSEKAITYLNDLQENSATDFAPWKWLNLYLWRAVYEI